MVKAFSATVLSYVLAVYLVDSSAPSFASFAALLVVQDTVYRSVLDAARYTGAVLVGLACAGIIGLTMGHNLVALMVLVGAALVIGYWRRLRQLGLQVAIVGVFAFAAGGSDDPGYLANLLLTVLCGALVGAGTDVVFAPPVRFQDAADAVNDVCSSMAALLTDIANKLRSPDPLAEADQWRDRSMEFTEIVGDARSEIDFRAENARLNPRRVGKGPPALTDYRHAVDTLGWAVSEVQGITLALLYAHWYDGHTADDELLKYFLPRYAALLDKAAEVTRTFGAAHTGADASTEQLSARLSEAQQHRDELTQDLRDAQPRHTRVVADCGALLVELERFLGRLQPVQP